MTSDQEWRDVARRNFGLLLSIDGIQPDKGNEPIYLVRDLLTGRLLTAENVTSSTKDTLKRVLAPVGALQLPILGVIRDAQESQLQARADAYAGNAPSDLSVSRAEAKRVVSFTSWIIVSRQICASVCEP